MSLEIGGQSFSHPERKAPTHPIHKQKRMQELLLKADNEPTASRRTEVVNHLIWSLFERCLPVKGNEEIIVTGHVLGDGRGDWFAMVNICKHLQKKFPDRTVRLIASSAEVWRGKLDASKIRALDLTYFGSSNDAPDVPESAFPSEAEILRKVKNAGVIISGPIGIAGVYRSILDEIKEKSIQVLEYEADTSMEHSFGNTKLQMGIDPSKVRCGIFISSDKRDYTWQNLQNKKLKLCLFGNDDPSQIQIEEYLSNHECFLGYMNQFEPLMLFVRDAVSFAIANSGTKTVDICLPCICKGKEKGFSEVRLEYLQEELGLDKLGIGSVRIIWMYNDIKMEQTIHLGEGNKEIRIIDPGNLSGKDFKILTRISAPLVGCTGDNSLAQALSYGKIPCYEPRKSGLFKALLNQIKENLGKESALYKYVLGTYNTAPWERFTEESVSHDELVEQAKQLGAIIRERASFNLILKGVVNERLCRQKDPDFALKEDHIRQEYLNFNINVAELENRMRTLLEEKGHL